MKKAIALILAVCMVGMLAACDTATSSSAPESDTPSSSASETSTDSSESADSTSGDSSSQVEEASSGDVTVSEQVLAEQDGIKITATGLDAGGIMGPELKVLIENTSDSTIVVQSASSVVNGYMIDASLSAEVTAGNSANEAITFLSSDVDKAGITTIGDIEISFNLIDPETYMTLSTTPVVTVSTSASGTFEQVYDDTGTEVYNEGGIRIVSKGLSDDVEVFGPSMLFYIENNTEQSVMIQTTGVSVNGFMIDAVLSEDVGAGKKAISALTFMSTSLEENGVTEVTDVELSFNIIDPATLQTTTTSSPIQITL